MEVKEFEAVAQKRVLKRMAEVVVKGNLVIQSPDENPKVPFKMTEFDFRNTVLDFPTLINPDELSTLVNVYKEGRYVNYSRFIEDLKQFMGEIKASSTGSGKITTPTKTQKINPKYVALAKYLQDRNTDLVSLVEHIDKTHCGLIQAHAFCGALPDFPLISEVARAAMNLKTREVDYRKLQSILNSIEVPKDQPERIIEEKPEVPQVVKEFAKQVHMNRADLVTLFFRENRTRSGLLPFERFFNLLVGLRLPKLVKEDLMEITRFFNENGFVDYAAFIKTVQANTDDEFIPPPPDVTLETAKKNLIQFFIDRRINVWSLFKPDDRSGSGKIPRNLFYKRISLLNSDIDERELKLVVDALTEPETKNVDYIAFAKEIYAYRSLDFDETIDSALQKLRDHLMEKNVMLNKILSMYDREKSGLIQTAQFIAGLRKIGYHLSEHDLILFRENYEDTKTKHFLRWKEICKDVDINYGDAAVVPNSTSQILFTPSMREILTTSSRQLQLYNTQQLSSGNPRESRPIPDHLIPLYAKIDNALNEFGFDLEGELISSDKLKKGTVPRMVFKQILDLLPLQIPPLELDELLEFYSDPSTGKIYYISFCNDIDDFGNQGQNQEEDLLEDLQQEEEKSNEPAKLITYADEVDKTPQVTRNDRSTIDISTLPPEVHPILSKFKEHVFVHNDILEEYFKKYDRLNNGLVPITYFGNAIGSIGIYITPAEYDILVRCFTSEEKSDMINYLRICNAARDLGADGTGAPIGLIQMSQTEAQNCEYLMNRLSQMIISRRSTFRKLFEGSPDKLPAFEFRTKLENVGLIVQNEDWKLILRKYKVDTACNIDIPRFIADSEKPKSLF